MFLISQAVLLENKLKRRSFKGNFFFYLLANALNKVVAMRLCTPLQTVTMSESLKKNTLCNTAPLYDRLYAHIFFCLFQTYTYTFSVFGLGNI